MIEGDNVFMEQKGLSKFAENAIAFGIAATIIIGIIAAFGWTSVTTWVKEPLQWKTPERVEITYNGAVPEKASDSEIELCFSIYNSTGKEIDEYYFNVDFGETELNIGLYGPDIKEYGSTDVSTTVTKSRYSMHSINESDFYKLKNGTYRDSDMTYKIEYMKSHGEKLISNKGWVKNLIIVAISFVFGLIGFESNIGNPVLRILFKTLGMPGILLVLGVMVVVSFAGGGGAPSYSNSGSVDNAARQRANERYKRAAQHKAGFEMHGNTREAARAQRQMDEAMADMITGAGNSDAKKRYKQYASWEAGAKMTGNQREAARSQAAKEKAFADILTERMKDD